MKYTFDCVIIGSGIAGSTAAIYLKRFNLNVLILDCDAPGGLLNKIKTIENYPGFTSISGPDLAYRLYEQLTNLNIEIRYGKVLSIKDHIITTDLESISANKIIIAVGRKAKKLDNNSNFKNISYCTLCDGNLYKDKVVAIVGKNNLVIDDCLFLSNICKKVYLILQENIDTSKLNANNIEIINGNISKINSNDSIITSINILDKNIKLDGLFICLGYEPQFDLLNEIKKEQGYIVVNEKMKTNIDYIYACGDIIKKDVYQLTTAVSEATIAAVNIKKDLQHTIK